MDNIELASIYRLTATNFRMSANVLFEDFKRRGETVSGNPRAIPFYYMVSHVVELLLKSALLKRGLTSADLKQQSIRHGLAELLETFKTRGGQVSVQTAQLVEDLGKQHKKHTLRYTALLDDGVTTFTPDPSMLFDAMDELLLAGRLNS